MITRRTFNKLALAGLTVPWLPAAFGQSSSALDQAIGALDQLHSIQIQQGDQLIYAQAPKGPGLDSLANIKSCSKSLVALLLASCLERKEITSLDLPLGEIAPNLIPKSASEQVSQITLENLVTLQAGLQGTSGAQYGAWVASSNWVADALSRPLVSQPGGRMIYSTGTTHVLGAVLTEASGLSLLELARQRLGQPLGISIPPWVRDPQGYYLGGNEMALTPRAMLSVALIMRDGGRFEGQQVISEEWIRSSVIPQTQSPFSGMGYGYGWFITDSGYILARGFGGQILAAHPELQLALAITSDPTRPAYSRGYFGDLMDLLDGPILELAKSG
ncbi:CubicO group peptidase, beta-lactamase class C family [Marinospirillum celere]|uniref:CubicO group peptidase, beta-lactamase class C family n=1 Tax=Marinospirillum celere TaxID=1122252 RepID=A0A1I1IB62_9GAMM|nr:serine hydrolase [Marinospirillum celere]SFC33241.1 CubicO group peptidase, beta-lactamase class C family [Marinospirillum celere]